ncbi:S-adenosylmethionine:tRNA ribosyltransferase-isomerase [Mycobacterium sp.]|uniref:S-adenosylmethionine:tRNA ribosyltransferase-isomerase n=1 Tax=Mycobacterium sp. TaxID=1785 RepID=UPI003BA8EE7B
MLAAPHTYFDRPASSDATEPPEAHGVARDAVKLLVATPRGITHTRFTHLGDYLQAGDLLVVNNSATMAAAVDGNRAGRPITVHFSMARDDGTWVVELRPAEIARGHLLDVRPGQRIDLPGGATSTVLSSYPDPGVVGSRLWSTRVTIQGDVTTFLARYGRPIRYAYVPRRWPLASYQTVFARSPGSAEMASAARPFSPRLVVSLVTSGIRIAPITLHAGVSSAEAGESPAAESFDVSPSTAQLVNLTRANGGRVVAVGTTATRALESAACHDGSVGPAHGWTEIVIGPDQPVRVVDGLITGWHDATASHLLLLEAVAGSDLIGAAYQQALTHEYLWHEFGDSALLLPDRPHCGHPRGGLLRRSPRSNTDVEPQPARRC